jgi:hypothetical protein
MLGKTDECTNFRDVKAATESLLFSLWKEEQITLENHVTAT